MLSFATRTWDGWDYVPHAWPIWLTAEDGVLLVGCAGEPADGSAPTDADGQPLEVGRPLAVARVALLSASEGWLEGIRVDPRVRGMDVATDLQMAELQWTAALGAGVVRYATGERNEASHRLGARHGFELLAAMRTYWWSDPATPDDEDGGHNDDDESGFGEEARRAAGETRTATLEKLAERGLVAADGAAWWPRVSADPTFRAAARLYEHRAWALQELTEKALHAHAAAGEVVAHESAGGWALGILQRDALPSEDVSLHLGLLVGDGAAALQLAEAIRQAAGTSIRFRLPADDPPLLRGLADAFASAGFRAREWTLHILGRRLTPGEMPRPGTAGLVLEDEPAPVVHAPARR
ncbi:MAG TPA: GNAT family N-acetyltransferase [Candidatus Limnocylindria bacterium]|nr:GNAT family N-acetyltransferase [Candidatus Limnocylindria bacterium]